jgi:hypothetical protein
MAIDINDPRARQMLLAGMPQQPMMQQPMAPQMVQPEAQGPDSLAQLTKLLGGDLSGSLTGGDKLLALAALMRSATRSGRRAGLTPQQVMGQLQQQKVAELQNRMAVEQMRAKMAQEQRQQQFLSKYSEALPEDMRGLLQTLSPDEAMKVASQEITRPKQVFQTKRDPQSGKMLIVFGDGTRQLTDVELPRNTKDRDIGNAIQVIDEDTGEVIETIAKEMNAYQAGMLSLAQSRERRLAAQPPSGGGGTTGKQTQLRTYKTPSGEVVSGEVRWDRSKDSWVDRAGNKVTLMPSPTAGTNYQIPPKVGERIFPPQ